MEGREQQGFTTPFSEILGEEGGGGRYGKGTKSESKIQLPSNYRQSTGTKVDGRI